MYTNLQQNLFTCTYIRNAMTAVKCILIILQEMFNCIIHGIQVRYLITGNLIPEFKFTCIDLYMYILYKIQWVPLNLIAAS